MSKPRKGRHERKKRQRCHGSIKCVLNVGLFVSFLPAAERKGFFLPEAFISFRNFSWPLSKGCIQLPCPSDCSPTPSHPIWISAALMVPLPSFPAESALERGKRKKAQPAGLIISRLQKWLPSTAERLWLLDRVLPPSLLRPLLPHSLLTSSQRVGTDPHVPF